MVVLFDHMDMKQLMAGEEQIIAALPFLCRCLGDCLHNLCYFWLKKLQMHQAFYDDFERKFHNYICCCKRLAKIAKFGTFLL